MPAVCLWVEDVGLPWQQAAAGRGGQAAGQSRRLPRAFLSYKPSCRCKPLPSCARCGRAARAAPSWWWAPSPPSPTGCPSSSAGRQTSRCAVPAALGARAGRSHTAHAGLRWCLWPPILCHFPFGRIGASAISRAPSELLWGRDAQILRVRRYMCLHLAAGGAVPRQQAGAAGHSLQAHAHRQGHRCLSGGGHQLRDCHR